MMFHSLSSPSRALRVLIAFLVIAHALIPPVIPSIEPSLDARAVQDPSFTNLTLTTLPTPTNLTFPKPQIICRTNALPTRRPISVVGCAEILFTLLSLNEIVPFQLFTSNTPWLLPAEYVDSRNTCEMRFVARTRTSRDQFPLSHVLQTAARIASHCQRYMGVNLGGNALVGPKQEFWLEVYGPGGMGDGGTTE